MTDRFFCDAVTVDGPPGGSHFLRQPCQGWEGMGIDDISLEL